MHNGSWSVCLLIFSCVFANTSQATFMVASALNDLIKAAEQGDAGAQTILGYMYNVGDGAPQNPILAYVWFDISSITGDKPAKNDRDLVAEKLSSEDLIKAQELSQEYYERVQASDNKGLTPLENFARAMREGKFLSRQ